MSRADRSLYSLYFKRLFDLVFSFVTIIILLPVFLVIILLIKYDSPGPAFYCQWRVGLNGREFKIYKFRTMVKNADQIGEKRTTIGDKRITKWGNFLRRSSIDELPQFINVFLGNMSVVGPRPGVIEHMDIDDSAVKTMLSVKPGITGYAQVYGRSNLSVEQMNCQIARYVEEISFYTDVKIILLTIKQVLLMRGTN